MDKLDKQLLHMLQENALQSVAMLAEEVGISKSACWRRLQKLEADGVIRERVALLDAAAVNLPLTAFISVRTNQHNDAWSKKFQRVVAGIPGVLEVYRMSGDVDYLLKVAVEDMQGYDRLYRKLIKAELFDVSSGFVMETLKHTTKLPLDALQLD
jgi:Lrp/AsnC family transcriptional regulator